MNSYKDDKAFLEQHVPLIELSKGEQRLLLSPQLQGRVLTTTFKEEGGPSFGWINKTLFASHKTLPHCNNWGGEDRFWLGPEGGQFSLFFHPHAKDYSFDNWQTPAIIDTEAWQLVDRTEASATVQAEAMLTNHSGTVFHCLLERTITLEDTTDCNGSLNVVRFSTKNSITNLGNASWTEDTGMPSIWILGQYNPSPQTKIIIPLRQGVEADLNENYFGAIGAERLQREGSVVLFTADGKKRGKIGIPPELSEGIAGAYDKENNILTYIKYECPAQSRPYVNAMWEHQESPFKGDAINAYNDGPLEDGSIMGPFYELESSSPAAALCPGESIVHKQHTTHIAGPEEEINEVAYKKLHYSIL